MDQQVYICSKCGCPDLEMSKSSIIVSADQKKVRCPNCKWEGTLSETTGILTTEKIFDVKAVLNLLLFVTTKHAAGPIAQALVFIGLIEKGDQEGIDSVMRAATEGIIEKAFMAAAEHAAKKGNIGEEKPVGKIDAPPGSEVVAGESMGIINTNAIHKLEILGGDDPRSDIQEQVKNRDSGAALDLPDIPPKDLKQLMKLLDAPITGPILMAQDTARDMGIDVDGLNAGKETVPFPPEMTAENAELFNIYTGEYDPDWLKRENAKVPVAKRAMNRLWEFYIAPRLLPRFFEAEKTEGQEIAGILVPEFIFRTWTEVYGEDATMLGHKIIIDLGGDFRIATRSST